MEEKDMLEIVDIRDATEEEIKEYTRKQVSDFFEIFQNCNL